MGWRWKIHIFAHPSPKCRSMCACATSTAFSHGDSTRMAFTSLSSGPMSRASSQTISQTSGRDKLVPSVYFVFTVFLSSFFVFLCVCVCVCVCSSFVDYASC